MVGLGDLSGGGFESTANGVSADGGVVVGRATDPVSGERTAFVWTQADGMQRLADVLLAQGATGLAGWTLVSANAISADGLTVAGFGVSPDRQGEGFVANLSPLDLLPDAFAFVDATDVPTSTSITSAPVTITGITGPATVSVIGGAYSVGCAGAFATATGTISNGETVCVRHQSAPTTATATATTLTVGGVVDTFTSTTAAGQRSGGGGGVDGASVAVLLVPAWLRRRSRGGR